MVTVIDNGEGISEEKLESILHTLNDEDDHEGDRIGLRNIHARIRMTYGDKYGLSIESKRGQGTNVTFSIPLQGGTDDKCTYR